MARSLRDVDRVEEDHVRGSFDEISRSRGGRPRWCGGVGLDPPPADILAWLVNTTIALRGSEQPTEGKVR